MDQKLDNLLNLALKVSQDKDNHVPGLDTGFDAKEKEWELIIAFAGNVSAVGRIARSVVELENGYAIVRIAESRIPELAQLPCVEYIEKPKKLYFQEVDEETHWNAQTGKGVLIAILDSGIDYMLPEFRKKDGTTRIRALWDQTISGKPPKGYAIGTEYTKEEIDEAICAETFEERRRRMPSVDTSGHGTAVAGIAAGNSTSYQGVAPESALLIVKLGNPSADGFPRTTELMQAVDYAMKKAQEWELPVVINISFGCTYGDHRGTSLLECYLDDIANVWKNVICVGSGNEGNSGGHTAGRVRKRKEERIAFRVRRYEQVLNLQLWKCYADEYELILVDPNGNRTKPLKEMSGLQKGTIGNTRWFLFCGEPSPYCVHQEMFIVLLAGQQNQRGENWNAQIASGVWKIILRPKKIISGKYEMWMPSQDARNIGTAFLHAVREETFTIPSTADQVITVGAYNPGNDRCAAFSGRGPATGEKPDVVAPGVDVCVLKPGGGTQRVTGTSFSTPVVSGMAARMMEWGIVKGNDPYLYGEKVKAYLQKEAEELPGYKAFPNCAVGYGALKRVQHLEK